MTPVPRPTCPKCQSELMLTRVTLGGVRLRLPYFFECSVCEHTHQTLGAPEDPMKSEETGGWLQGELRAPVQQPQQAASVGGLFSFGL